VLDSRPVAFAIEASGVTKRLGTRDALAGVDLFVRAGRLHGLLGPNGAGKTTLMRVLLGLMRADAGNVRLLGQPAAFGEPLADGIAGFVETPGFYPYLSAEENLSLLARLDAAPPATFQPPVGAGFSLPSDRSDVASGSGRTSDRPASRRDRIRALLAQVGLDGSDVPVAGYSAGMRQRLGLAAALLRSPKLLLLDEPTSSLDPAGARDVRTLIRQLRTAGATIVLSSHDMTEVEELCSDLTVIDTGRVVFSGTIDELRRRAPAAAYVMRTSDDAAAIEVSRRHPRVSIRRVSPRDDLEIDADAGALDEYVIALGQARIAVRGLERRVRSLESLFLDLTGEPLAAITPSAAGSVENPVVYSEALA
jgi:ABC-2 type transport system ATP-binding protein